jgi:protein-tyrosine phosphatase family protein
LSNVYLEGLMAELSTNLRHQGIDPGPMLANLELREGYLVPMLDALDVDFGGIDEYLRRIGVTLEELATFRAQFLG